LAERRKEEASQPLSALLLPHSKVVPDRLAKLAGARRGSAERPYSHVSRPISRVLDGMRTFACVTAIPLGRRSPSASSNLPGRLDPDIFRSSRLRTASRRPYSVLLPVGFAVPPALPPARCALTAPFHPCRGQPNTPWRYVFCGTVPGFAPAGCYPAPLVRGARTFLSGNLSVSPERPSDRLTYQGWGYRRCPSRVEAGQSRHELKDQGRRAASRSALAPRSSWPDRG